LSDFIGSGRISSTPILDPNSDEWENEAKDSQAAGIGWTARHRESQIVGSGFDHALNEALRDSLADVGHPRMQEGQIMDILKIKRAAKANP
jgi:hypothetical protein